VIEIRFRAWDTVEKQFVYFELYKGVNKHTPPIYPEAQLEEWEMFLRLPDHPDITGVWENDIVKWINHICRIVWNNELFQFEMVELDTQNQIDLPVSTSSHFVTDNIEYLGNIHENPELLKENNGTNEEV